MIIAFHYCSNPYDWVIKEITKGPFSHCGIVTADGTLWQARPFYGVTKTPNADIRGWPIRKAAVNEKKAIKFMEEELGCGYDYPGVIRFVIPSIHQSPTRWFCSEFAEAALHAGGWPAPHRAYTYSPNALWVALSQH